MGQALRAHKGLGRTENPCGILYCEEKVELDTQPAHSRAKSGLRARKPDISRWTTAGGLALVRGAAVRVEFNGLLAQGCSE